MCPFIIDRLAPRGTVTTGSPAPDVAMQRPPRAASPQSLRIGIDLLLSLLKLANANANSHAQSVAATDPPCSSGAGSVKLQYYGIANLQPIVDLIPLLLADFAGLLKVCRLFIIMPCHLY